MEVILGVAVHSLDQSVIVAQRGVRWCEHVAAGTGEEGT